MVWLIIKEIIYKFLKTKHIMNILKNNIFDNKITDVYSTYDYDKFKILFGNRKLNEIHLKRLMNSFQKNYLFSPILVNNNFEIIDGQHRFNAAKELGLPINYMIMPAYGLNEVKVLNTNTSNWNKMDYLMGYCDSGSLPYLQMRQFMKDFPDFGIYVCEQLLTNNTKGINNTGAIEKGRGRLKNFEEGRLIIPDINKSYENAHKVLSFKKYYDGYNRAIFVAALIGIFKHANYNHQEMISKLSLQPSALTHCTNVEYYKVLIENIYNYKRRNKLTLRY
jgi:hypothetical protein